MAFYNPVSVELFDENDDIIMPITVPISITVNLEAFGFDYIAVQVETYDKAMREVLQRWTNKELIQYRVTGRFGTQTGDVNSVYIYDDDGSGEFSFYGRNHKEIFQSVIGYIDPTLNAVQRTYNATHKKYAGSALKVMRDVLTDNLVNRIGQSMTFPSGDLGNQIKVDFRFDEIHKHLYEDGFDRGGPELKKNGNIIFDVIRNFSKHRYELKAREPEHLERAIEVRSGLVDRWQITASRGEADKVIVGGPREMADRIFGSTEGDSSAPKTQAVAKAERKVIQDRIAALAKTRNQAKATERGASSKRRAKLKATLTKAERDAQKAYTKEINKANSDYDAAMKKAKTDSEKSSAKYARESAIRSAESTRKYAVDRARKDYKEATAAEGKTSTTNLRNADLKYKTDVATQHDLLKNLLRQWPFPNRRFPAEMYTEDTSPEGVDSDKMNPSDPAEKLNTIAEIADVLDKVAVTKRGENAAKTQVSGQILESDSFYLGEHIALGDYVMIGIDEHTNIGEQQIEKVIITWSKADGYKVELGKPDEADTTDEDTLKRIIAALKQLSTKTGRH